MKYTLHIFRWLSICFICFSTTLSAQQNKAVTFVTALKPEQAESITWEADGPTKIQYWSKNYIRIVITIEQSNMERPFHKMLATKGYYKPRIKSTKDRRAMTISFKGESKPIYINDQLMENTISYTVYAPNHIDLKPKTLMVGAE
ncbi:MAG: hypothetical protein AAF990_14345 [Bacteroidota bacterium]